ncbi:MAG TPA: Dabb family protein [Spirochaetota bacterium]
MITHIVFFNVAESAEGMNKNQILSKMKSDLESLKGKVPQIRELSVGINAKPDSNAWDLALYTKFDSFDALDAYQKNPDHVAVAQFIGKVRTGRAVVDYEG